MREQQKVVTTEDNWDMIRSILLGKLPEVTEREYAKQAQFIPLMSIFMISFIGNHLSRHKLCYWGVILC